MSTKRYRQIGVCACFAADTAVDWSRIHAHSDWEALGDNSLSFADVIIEQVLKNKHHALVVLGTNHVLKGRRPGIKTITPPRAWRHSNRAQRNVALLICHGGVAMRRRTYFDCQI